MVLVGEDQETARHAARLQGVEGGQALGDGQTVVQLAVDDLIYTKTSAPSRREAAGRERVQRTSSGVAHRSKYLAGSHFS